MRHAGSLAAPRVRHVRLPNEASFELETTDINFGGDDMLKVALWIVVAIFVIGLLVVLGVLDFIF
jgi:hypothetical protein